MSVFSEIIPLDMKRAKELCRLCTYPSGMEMFEITHMFPSLVKRIEELESPDSAE
jgi:hypothetical protein